MKENLELDRSDIRVHHDMEVDCDIGQQITAYIETWFDASRKFGSQAQLQDGEWLNMYAKYNPFEDTLRMECEICRESGSTWFDYTPTAAESRLFKDMITETIREVHKQTPQEFCRSVQQNVEPVFVYENRGRLSPEQIIQKGFRLKYHCEENNYLQSGSLSISEPMSRCGSELQWIMDYCRSHGISKILVDGLLDIGRTPDEVDKTAQILCARGFQVEVADCGLIYSPQNEAPEQNSGMTMGGM